MQIPTHTAQTPPLLTPPSRAGNGAGEFAPFPIPQRRNDRPAMTRRASASSITSGGKPIRNNTYSKGDDMAGRSYVLDDESKRFQAEVDALVRKWSGDDDTEYLRRWRQLGSWSINRTQGDVWKKDALKKLLMERTGGTCADCGQQFPKAALQMHRQDPSFISDRSRNFGYFEGNVILLCAHCHAAQEEMRRQVEEQRA